MDSIQGSTMDMGVPVFRVQTQRGAPSKGPPPFQNQSAVKNPPSAAKNSSLKSENSKTLPHTSSSVKRVPQNVNVANKSEGTPKKVSHNSNARNVAQNSKSIAGNARNQDVNQVASQHRQRNDETEQTQQNRSQRKPRWRDSKKKHNQDVDNDCKVTVSGYPEYTQPKDLEYLFCQFGTVTVQGKNIEAAILSFSNAAEAYEALQASNKIALYGEILTVKPYSPSDPKHHTQKRTFVRSQQKSVIVSPCMVDLSGEFPAQLAAVLAAVRLGAAEVAALGDLYRDLENVLQPLWPGCKAIPFGSIPTGLGIKTSDADCFMLIPQQFRHQQSMFVSRTRRLLQMYPTIFDEILAIPRANTPIVKFFHIPTGTNCDVSFKTPLGTRNSALVFFLLSSDPRLIPLAVLVKYWAKVHDLSGTGKLTNYALTMLVIFYLQQPPLSILPSVAWLQTDPQADNLVDNWNTGFMNCHENLPRSTNTSSVSELIGGFFQYYSTFNFADMIVCPYLGKPVPKTMFKNLQDLPPEFERYQQNVNDNLSPQIRFLSPMVIQDPFEQCHNVASLITSSLSGKIKAFFAFAANAYETEKLNNCQNFLAKILLQKPKYVEKRTQPEYKIRLVPRSMGDLSSEDRKRIVKEIIFDVFEKMCQLQLTKVGQDEGKKPNQPESRQPSQPESRQPTQPESKKEKEKTKEKEKYSTTITKPLWNRERFSRDFMNLKLIEKQSKITEEIAKTVEDDLAIKIHVTIMFYVLNKSMTVSIKLIEGDPEMYREFGRFFLAAIQQWIRKLLKPHATNPGPVPSTNSQHHYNLDKITSDTDDEALDESQLKNNEQTGGNDTAKNMDSDDSGHENSDS